MLDELERNKLVLTEKLALAIASYQVDGV